MTCGQWLWVAVWVACALLTLDLAHALDDDGVRTPPLIQTPVKSETKYIARGSSETLECHATGKPTPTYKWMKNSVDVESDASVSVISKDGRLIFQKFDQDQEGEYMCVAQNVYDGPDGKREKAAAMSAPIKVLEMRLGDFASDIEVVKTGNADEYMMFECRDKGVIQLPQRIFNWYKGSTSNQLGMDNGRLFVDTTGNLHFSFLKKTDEEIDTYRCGVSNTVTNIVLGSPTKLDVTVPTSDSKGIKPLFQYSNTGVQAMLFSTVKLECFFSGYDPRSETKVPQVKWYDDASNEITAATRPTKYKVHPFGRQLEILNVQEADEKNYYCLGENALGKTTKQSVALDVISAPIFLADGGAPQELTKPEHTDAVFHCSTRSLRGEQPPSTPEWYLNGVKAGPHNDPDKYNWSADKKTLTIEKLSKAKDIQCVQCKVSNNYGTTWGAACLNVVLGIELTNDPLLTQKIKKGDIVNLTVTATTDPSATLKYVWLFKNETYDTKPPHVLYNQETKQAIINTSLLTQKEYETIGGVYTRRLYHGYDQKLVDMEVILTDGPVVGPVVSKGGIDMWIIGLIIGILFLIIVIIIIIFVVCRKKQEGDYNVDKKETGAGLDPERELKEKGFGDYSRPTYDDYEYPDKKPRGELEYDDVPIGGDDESLGEYGDEADTHFNEDGSFIGVYQNNRGKGQPKSNESTI